MGCLRTVVVSAPLWLAVTVTTAVFVISFVLVYVSTVWVEAGAVAVAVEVSVVVLVLVMYTSQTSDVWALARANRPAAAQAATANFMLNLLLENERRLVGIFQCKAPVLDERMTVQKNECDAHRA